MKHNYTQAIYLFLALIVLAAATEVAAQSTAFTYQGRLTDNGTAASGTYEMQFALYDAAAGGIQVGSTVENASVSVLNGIFTTQLDFGSAPFGGAERYLEVRVRRNSSESYSTLTPRHPIGRVPYATNSIAGGDERAKMLGALRWDLFRTPTSYPVVGARGIAFDGSDIWISTSTGNIIKMRTSDGAILGTYTVGSDPRGIASDGTNVWVANFGSGTVTKLRASDGAVQGTFTVGTNPIAVCFDGANIWVVNNGSANVSRLRASDGQLLNTFINLASPTTIVFDGTTVWIGSASGIVRRRASDGLFLSNLSGNGSVMGYDGYHHWVTVGNGFDIYRLRSSDGYITESTYVGGAASTMVFDGKSLWVGIAGPPTVNRINTSSPRDLLATWSITLPSAATGSAFDGKNVWFMHSAGVTKVPAYP